MSDLSSIDSEEVTLTLDGCQFCWKVFLEKKRLAPYINEVEILTQEVRLP